METVKLDYIFNYVSPIIRQILSDDDQIKSWAMQAFRTLDDKSRYVDDIAFLEVVNHKATLPTGIKKILSARKYANTEVCVDCLTTDIELPSYDSFTEPLNISMEYFITSSFYQDSWSPIIRVPNLDADYLCTIKNGSCDDLYSLSPGSPFITFSFLEGTVVLKVSRNAVDCNGEFLLPREPEKLWFYLGSYCTYKFWDQQTILGKDGAYRNKKDSQLEMANLRGDAKAALMFGNISLSLHRELTYGEMRIGKVPAYQHRLQNWRANV